MPRINLCSVVLCSILIGNSFGCLPNLMGGSSGGSGGCCPPTPSCPQANQCSSSYVSPPSSGPASYPIPPSSYAQQPQQYAQPSVAAAVQPPPSPKYPTAGK